MTYRNGRPARKISSSLVPKVSEADVQRTILDWIARSPHFAFRVNTMGVPMLEGGQLKRFRPSPNKGVADIIGLTGTGRFFAIEVKAPGKKASPEQITFLQEVADHGGIALVADNLEFVIEKLT